MHLSTHYYVLALGAKTNALFEAFRDSLIPVENQGFPIEAPVQTSNPANPADQNQLRGLARTIDECFDHYYMLEALPLVVVGEKEMQSAFSAVTAHKSAVIGYVEGDHTATDARDLGKIVWPIVKGAMSGALDNAMRDLEAYAVRGHIVSGLEMVARLASEGMHATLLVEENFHVRGSIGGTSYGPVISPDVDVRETIDDAVDAVIEKVLKSGGNIVFAPDGSLSGLNRIVLLPHSAEASSV